MSYSRHRRDMSNEERRAYRRRKRLIRRIQVYSEMAAITIAILVVGGLIVSHIKGNSNTMTVTAEGAEAKTEKEESTGLKVSSGDVDPDAAIDDEQTPTTGGEAETIEEEPTPTTGAAKENLSRALVITFIILAIVIVAFTVTMYMMNKNKQKTFAIPKNNDEEK